LVLVNLSEFVLAAILRSAALCMTSKYFIRKWFVTTVLTLPTHVLQPQSFVRIFCNDSEAIFRVFQLFSLEVKYLYQKNTSKNS